MQECIVRINLCKHSDFCSCTLSWYALNTISTVTHSHYWFKLPTALQHGYVSGLPTPKSPKPLELFKLTRELMDCGGDNCETYPPWNINLKHLGLLSGVNRRLNRQVIPIKPWLRSNSGGWRFEKQSQSHPNVAFKGLTSVNDLMGFLMVLDRLSTKCQKIW